MRHAVSQKSTAGHLHHQLRGIHNFLLSGAILLKLGSSDHDTLGAVIPLLALAALRGTARVTTGLLVSVKIM